MPEPKRVALLIEKEVGFCERVLNGVARYANENANWIYRGSNPHVDHAKAMPRWNPHGVIAGIWDPRVADVAATLNVPVIDVFDWGDYPCTARIATDDAANGALAADHYIERGLRHFAFTGEIYYHFVQARRAGFEAALSARGMPPPHVHALEFGNSSWGFYHLGADTALCDWLRGLPKPIGVLAASDDSGLRVLEAARGMKLRVPDDLAVLGVDNNVFLCNLAHPPLSSIDVGPERIGFEAARLLDRAMAGRGNVPRRSLVQPAAVVARQSTDTLAITDHDVAAVVRAIRRSASGKANIAALIKDVPVRRRTLERRFRAVLGHGMHDEIRNTRIERARQLLADSDMAMPAIAVRCGFGNAERLSRVFRQILGTTPTAYRKQFRPTE